MKRKIPPRIREFVKGTWKKEIPPHAKELAKIYYGNKFHTVVNGMIGGSGAFLLVGGVTSYVGKIVSSYVMVNRGRHTFESIDRMRDSYNATIRALHRYSTRNPDFEKFLGEYPEIFVSPQGVVVGAKKIPLRMQAYGLILDSHSIWTGMEKQRSKRKLIRKKVFEKKR